MAQKNRALIVIGSLVVIGSIGYYLFTKSKKSKGAGSSEPTPDDKPIVGKDTTKEEKKEKQGKKDTINRSTQNGYVVPESLNSVEKIQLFQAWLDTTYPKWYNGKKLGESSKYYGTLGTNTKSAWESYGKEYLKWLANLNLQTEATQKQNQLDAIKKKFPKGKSVLANITFRTRANTYRNGAYYSTDSEGKALPSKEFLATAEVGKVLEVLDNGYVVVQLSKPITEGAFSNNYWYIQGPSYWFK
jgi:hypothetical protein